MRETRREREREAGAPVLDAHEDPAHHALGALVEPPRASEDALHAARRHELDLDVAAPDVLDPDRDGDVLELVDVGALEVLGRHLDRRRRAGGRDELARLGVGLVGVGDRARPPRLGLDELPALGELDDGVRVELAEPVLVVVRPARGRHLPVRVGRVDLDRRADAQVLHVAPREVGPSLEDEGEDAGGDGRCGRRAAVTVGARVLADVGRVLRARATASAGDRRWRRSEGRV